MHMECGWLRILLITLTVLWLWIFVGGVGNPGCGDARIGLRPIVCLKSNVLLEADGDGYMIK